MARSRYYPGHTIRRDDGLTVKCDECGHESAGTFFGRVDGPPRKGDAWQAHRRHWSKAHGRGRPN